MTEVFYGLDGAHRDRIAGLRARGRFFWLDVSLSETTLDELREALDLPEAAVRALRRSADAYASRTFHADGESVVFVLRCYVESETPADEAAYRLRPLRVDVLVTGEYLVTLHDEPVSLPAVLAPDLPEERSERYAVYSVVDAMLASTFEALEEVELRLDAFASTSTRRGWRAGAKDDAAGRGRSARGNEALGGGRASGCPAGGRGGRGAPRLRHSRRAVLRACGRAGEPVGGLGRRRRERRRDAAGSTAERAGLPDQPAGDDLRAAHVPHRVLRHELRVDDRSDRHPDRVLAGRNRRSDRAGAAVLASVGAPLSHEAIGGRAAAERSAVWLCLDAHGG